MKKLSYLTLVLLSVSEAGFALPKEGQIICGEATIQHQPGSMQIKTDDRAIINWSSFNIGKNELVQFIQPSTSSAVLNRDIGGLPSQILGALSANGHVYLVNQNGLIIGDGATINAASLFASTLDILNDRFMQGGDLLFQGELGGMIRLGSFTCERGDVVFIGRQIAMDGDITIKEGTVTFGSGMEVLLKPQESEKIFIRPAQETPQEGTGIDLKGTLSALQVKLKADGNLYQVAIKNAAHVEAMTTVERNGEIFMVAENGFIDVDGGLLAKGGEIKVLGDYVKLSSNASLDVSSDTKGGTVLVGGDFQGKNEEIPNAKLTAIAPEVVIDADAKVNGNGGKVIVWGNDATGFYGRISAQGGPEGGDGGFIEVSGKHLDYQGSASTLASKGRTGKLLLDPVDVTISAAATSANEMLMVINPMLDRWTPTACLPAANINNAALVASWMANNVEVVTTFGVCAGQVGNITVIDPVSIAAPGTPNTLTLTADNDIYVGASITNAHTVTGAGTVSLHATSSILVGSTAPLVPAVQAVVVGVANGLTVLLADTGNIEIGDSTGTGLFSAQVGWGLANPTPGATLNGIISITATAGSVTLQGGSGADRAFAQIGHGEINPVFGMQTTMTGTANLFFGVPSIDVAAGQHIRLFGGKNGRECYTQIGHGGINVNNTTNALTGSIELNAGGLISLMGGQGLMVTDLLCYAQIGHMGGSDIPQAPGPAVSNTMSTIGRISIGQTTPGTSVTVTGGTTERSWAFIGHGGDNRNAFGNVAGNIGITTANAGATIISAIGGLGTSAFAQIGHGGGGEVNIGSPTMMHFGGSVTGDIIISAPSTAGILTVGGAIEHIVVPTRGVGSYGQIGHGGLLATTDIGGDIWAGDITITAATPAATTLNVNVTAGNCLSAYAQIGHGGIGCKPNAIGNPTANISVTGSFITVTGPLGSPGDRDSGDFSYGQIGHGGAFVQPAGDTSDADLIPTSGQINGSITVLANSGFSLTGDGVTNPNANFAPGLLGHGSFVTLTRPGGSVMNPTWQLIGDISLTCQGSGVLTGITISAGVDKTQGGAWIGHGPVVSTNTNPLTINGNINVTGNGSSIISITGGGLASLNTVASIGHGAAFTNPNTTFLGSETVIGANIGLLGGLGPTTAGIAPFGSAVISSPSLIHNQTITANGPALFNLSVTLNGGNADLAHASIVANGPVQNITSALTFQAVGGQPSGGNHKAWAFVANLNLAGETIITAQNGDVLFYRGFDPTLNLAVLQGTAVIPFTQAKTTVQASGDIALSSSLLTFGANSISLLADTNNDGFGAFKVDTATHNVLGTQLAPGTTGISIGTTSAPLLIHGSSKYNRYGQVAADFQIGDPTDLSLLASNNLMPATLFSGTGSITVDLYRNIYVTSGTLFGVGAGGDILLVADNDIAFSGTGKAQSNNSITIVVDNQNPASPGIGPGAFSKDATSIIMGNDVRIFTARRSQNSVAGQINGTAFAPGPLFVNSVTERWGVYFPSSVGGIPFTIFYKEFLPPGPVVLATISSQTSLSQLFYYFDQWDRYLYWDRRFNISYARETYHHLDRLKMLTSLLQPYERSPFFRSLLPGIGDQRPVWTFDVIEDRELTLPPEWKADGRQYNTTVY